LPAHIGVGPVTDTTGRDKTVMALLAVDRHPVEVCVKVKLAWPAPIPVTKPLLLTVATKGLREDHVPPTVGLSCPVCPIQIFGFPNTVTSGPLLTVTTVEESDLHPVAALVKINRTVPSEWAVTRPLLFTLATEGLDEIQLPPEEGSS